MGEQLLDSSWHPNHLGGSQNATSKIVASLQEQELVLPRALFRLFLNRPSPRGLQEGELLLAQEKGLAVTFPAQRREPGAWQ